MQRIGNLCTFWGVAIVAASIGWAASAAAEFPLLVEDSFEQGMDRWSPSDAGAARPVWSIVAEESVGANHVLRVSGKSSYQPPQTSPHSIAMLKDVVVGDFEMTCRVQNTNPGAGGHRDLCFFWGYQDASHFYYVHLGAEADPHSCQIFVVDGADRKKITERGSAATPWSDGWHNVKVVRRVADGTMEVYFDNMETPIMTANDQRFAWGQVGLGTFDDNGNFDDFELRGVAVEPVTTETPTVTVEESERGAVVEIDGKLFAEYLTHSGHQPVVWPLVGPRGEAVTRSYPMGERGESEKADHPHHRSLWFTHGDVNGLDFWLEPREGKPNNQITHREFVKLQRENDRAIIVTANDWTSDGEKVCEDERTLVFLVDPDGARAIDYTIEVKATDGEVTFGDTKEGAFAVRVAGSMKVTAGQGGKIVSSRGKTNGKAWAQPAEWVDYTGPVNGEPNGITIFSHPDSFRHPCSWHVRTYGLFAANPFARRHFGEGGKDQGPVTIRDGESLKLRYLVYLHDGTASADELEARYKKYTLGDED